MEVNKIICGDCIDEMKKLKDNSVDLIVTDPPYKLSQRYGNSVDSDNLISVASIMKSMNHFSRLLKNGRFVVIFYDSRILPLLFESVKGTDLRYKGQIFLYRRWGTAHMRYKWMSCTDPVLIFQKGEDKPFRPKDIGKIKHDCYIKDKPERESFGHPAQKPEEIIGDIIESFSDEGDLVLDSYCGVGTVPKMCKQLNRKFIGFELSKEYCDIANKRFEQIQLREYEGKA